jgi:predicted ATPase
MITALGFKNFKCFDSIDIPMRQVNLLTGINGRGKSTSLQSMLLMRQSPERNLATDQVILNGSCVELGNYRDIRNGQVPRSESVEFRFTFAHDDTCTHLTYVLAENQDDDMVAQIEMVKIAASVGREEVELQIHPKSPFLLHKDAKFDLFWKNLIFERIGDATLDAISHSVNFTNIHYLSADRIGPREYYPKQNFTSFPNVGARGEYTANILSKKGADIVAKPLQLGTGATETVIDQAEAWLTKIFDGGRITVTPTDANLVMLSINSHKPANDGFGYSYALPIIVSGLIAKQREIVIIENPEAHLHPYAQSQLSQFLARLAKSGIQVFIESHSDHILNGLRIAVADKVLNPADLNILYYPWSPVKGNVVQIPLDEHGAIEDWPEGFFDQTNKDFSRLFGV